MVRLLAPALLAALLLGLALIVAFAQRRPREVGAGPAIPVPPARPPASDVYRLPGSIHAERSPWEGVLSERRAELFLEVEGDARGGARGFWRVEVQGCDGTPTEGCDYTVEVAVHNARGARLLRESSSALEGRLELPGIQGTSRLSIELREPESGESLRLRRGFAIEPGPEDRGLALAWGHPVVVVEGMDAPPLISSGAVCDRVVIDLAGIDAIHVPADAVVEAGSEPGRAVVLVRRARLLAGNPRESLDAAEFAARLRQALGVAARRDGASLHLASFGEWESPGEGGESVSLRILIPDRVRVSHDPGSSGAASSGQDAATRRPASGWTVLETRPDSSMAAIAPALADPRGGGRPLSRSGR